MIEEQLNREMMEIQNSSRGRITVGAPFRIAEFLLPIIWPRYMEQYPSVELKLETRNPESIETFLKQGKIDFSFTTWMYNDSDFTYTPLITQHLVLVTPSTYYQQGILEKPRAGEDIRTILQQYCNLPFILPDTTCQIREEIDRFFRDVEFVPYIALEFDSSRNIFN